MGGRPGKVRREVYPYPRWRDTSRSIRCVVAVVRHSTPVSVLTSPRLCLAIQFAKLSGYNPIIATASTHNASFVKLYGATHVVDRKLSEERTIAEVHAIAGGPVDLVYDAVSEDSTLRLAAAAVREGGQAVVVLPGQEELSKTLFDPKHVEWVIARGFQSSERNKGALAGLWKKLPELLKEGALKVRASPKTATRTC